MKEKAVLLGKTRTLVGIITDPASGTQTPAHATVLLLNAGLLHRIGPSRMYVRLARELAAAGFPVLRLDFSGIGDSEARRDNVAFEEAALEEVRDAMDLMAKAKGSQRFLLMGLCSGADNAFQAARVEPRVAGIALIDGFAYRTPGFWLRYYQERMLDLGKWKQLLVTKFGAGGKAESEVQAGEALDDSEASYVRGFPPIDQTRSDLEAMASRGISVLFAYSAGQYQYYNHAEQFDDAFRGADFRGRITSRFFPSSNHTFTRHAHRDELIDAIRNWAVTTTTAGSNRAREVGAVP